MKNILLIEDEPNVAAFIKRGLSEENYDVRIAYDGKSALEILQKHRVDLIVLDLILPDMSGLEICRRIRSGSSGDVLILMLTALGTTNNIVKGLDTGADDYLTKPFKFRELLARIKALFRRMEPRAVSRELIKIADLELDCTSRIVTRGGKEIQLTATEYRLLEYFMKNRRRVLSRVDLLENVWDINFDRGTNVVDVYVNYLRNKIDRSFDKKLIHTVIGMGYIMKE